MKHIKLDDKDVTVTTGKVETRNINDIRKDIHDLPDYEGLPLAVLRENSTVMFDVYVKVFDSFKMIAKHPIEVTKKFIDGIKVRELDTVYAPKGQKGEIYRYCESNLDSIVQDDSLPVEKKSTVIYSTATDIAEELFSKPVTTEAIMRTKSVVKPMLDSILTHHVTLNSLLAVSSYDYYTYTHSVDVSIYSIGIGKELGLGAPALNLLGEAAILHDLGKSQVDIAIVNKNGRLTNDEFSAMKMHPSYAHQLLVEHGVKNPTILAGVRDHHEKLNGMGYPNGIKGEAIGKFARIIAIADIFDALTTRRSYKPALGTFEALKIMKHQMEGELDPELLKLFIVMMSEKHQGSQA